MPPQEWIHWLREVDGTSGGNFTGGGRLMAPLGQKHRQRKVDGTSGQIHWWRAVDGTSDVDLSAKGG